MGTIRYRIGHPEMYNSVKKTSEIIAANSSCSQRTGIVSACKIYVRESFTAAPNVDMIVPADEVEFNYGGYFVQQGSITTSEAGLYCIGWAVGSSDLFLQGDYLGVATTISGLSDRTPVTIMMPPTGGGATSSELVYLDEGIPIILGVRNISSSDKIIGGSTFKVALWVFKI